MKTNSFFLIFLCGPLPANFLANEPDFQKDYPLEEGLYIRFDPNA